MIYALNDYYKLVNSTFTCVEVYSNNTIAALLLAHHLQNDYEELGIYECIDVNALTLPMPGSIMPILDKKILSSEKRVVVTGIDSYLTLIAEKDRKTFMIALHNRIDNEKMNAIYLISRNMFDTMNFKNPKYENALQVVYIGNEGQYFTEPCVSVVSSQWVKQGNNPANWKSLLKTLGQFEPTGNYILIHDNNIQIQAGLSPNIMQIIDTTFIAQQFYELPACLGKKVLEKLMIECQKSDQTVQNLLEERFGAENMALHLAIKRLFELQANELWPAYVWYVKQGVNAGSYLAKVLSDDVSAAFLLQSYICSTAIEILKDKNANEYARERAMAVRELGDEAIPFINEFIIATRLQPDIIIAGWLNCGTEIENIEIVRRVAETDLTVGLPQLWQKSYSMLSYYLSDEYDYGSEVLTAYFRDYRRLKIADTITEEFIKSAYDSVLSNEIASRDVLVQKFSADRENALLIVDGMGAEYYPLLLGLAKKHRLNVEFEAVASVCLPSSTKYNGIKWDKTRLLEPVHGIDNVSHNGAEKFEINTSEQNIVATFSKFEVVIKRINQALKKYKQVIVTGDHGSSRLAVIAHEEGASKTLPWEGEPESCRYGIAPQHQQAPSEFESYYDAEQNKTYWMVRGYNRLPKKGKMSVHGGATMEERLVPVIVFSMLKLEKEIKVDSKKLEEQLVEKMDFDDI